MPRYANWLAKGMEERGHQVESWSPKAYFSALSNSSSLKKWLGYIDQYVIFPIQVKARLKKISKDTLFVFTDHALGPWVPLVKDRLHIVHCHDFLAQRSALGEIPENVTGRTGKIYQSYIRKGYSCGRNFISISRKTQADLHQMLPKSPLISEVVYNGLTRRFSPPTDVLESRINLSRETGIDLRAGFILHVGGNLWYKNRPGVVAAYDEWRQGSKQHLPLILIGDKPDDSLQAHINRSAHAADIHPLAGMPDDFTNKAYSAASLFLFPSLAEGFGWPIIEAMASGCPVITTDEAPMNEVGGKAAFYVSKMQIGEESQWLKECASAIEWILHLSEAQKSEVVSSGLQNINRFSSESALDKVEQVYRQVELSISFRTEPELQK